MPSSSMVHFWSFTWLDKTLAYTILVVVVIRHVTATSTVHWALLFTGRSNQCNILSMLLWFLGTFSCKNLWKYVFINWKRFENFILHCIECKWSMHLCTGERAFKCWLCKIDLPASRWAAGVFLSNINVLHARMRSHAKIFQKISCGDLGIVRIILYAVEVYLTCWD